MIYTIFQRVTHPQSEKVFTRQSKIVGRDLPHAVTQIRGLTSFEKRELLRKFWTRRTDPQGRTLYIEITEEV